MVKTSMRKLVPLAAVSAVLVALQPTVSWPELQELKVGKSRKGVSSVKLSELLNKKDKAEDEPADDVVAEPTEEVAEDVTPEVLTDTEADELAELHPELIQDIIPQKKKPENFVRLRLVLTDSEYSLLIRVLKDGWFDAKTTHKSHILAVVDKIQEAGDRFNAPKETV
jgi:hypothetical protein